MDMVNKASILLTPGSAFGPSGDGYVRMALVQDVDILIKAVQQAKDSGIFHIQKRT